MEWFDNFSKMFYTQDMEMRPGGILNYITPTGRNPFRRWYTRLKDQKARAIIANRIERLHRGHLGDFKRLSKSLYELRIHYTPGYRIYFGVCSNNTVILLCGGTKQRQQQDIARAQTYWNEFLERI